MKNHQNLLLILLIFLIVVPAMIVLAVIALDWTDVQSAGMADKLWYFRAWVQVEHQWFTDLFNR